MLEYVRFFRECWEALQGMQGMGGLAIVAVFIQLIMKFLKLKAADGISGPVKLMIVTGLSVVGAVIAGISAGLPIMTVILSGPVLASVQVFVHQVLKQIGESKNV